MIDPWALKKMVEIHLLQLLCDLILRSNFGVCGLYDSIYIILYKMLIHNRISNIFFNIALMKLALDIWASSFQTILAQLSN